MSKTLILIPSAKAVPESLQSLGRLPAVIYPVAQRIMFDYLYEQYAEISGNIKVVCYENSNEVVRKLSLYGEKVSVKILPELKDLGYTIYEGLENESGPVIINFADTIVMDNISGYKGDCFYYSEDYISDSWTFFTMQNEKFTSIIDKKPAELQGIKGKLFAGVFRITQPQILRKCLEDSLSNPQREISTFYQALNEYNKLFPMTALYAREWCDIGHADKYFSSRLEVSAREFNYITVDRNRGTLCKTSDNKDKLINEIKWYLKLPAELEYAHPRIFSYSTHYEKPYVMMEYYSYHTVHELFLYGDMNFQQWQDIFSRIYFVCKDFRRYTANGENIRSSIEEMYLTKTLQRLETLRDNKNFSNFFSKPVKINGEKYFSLDEVITLLKKYIPELLCKCEKFTIIHGDLCFTNIMIDPNLQFIKLIDPRGSFGAYDIYGDPDYDLAKLFHSIDGKYDFIIKNMFTVNADIQNASVEYKICDGERNYDLIKMFREIFSPDMKRVRLIEALLFLSMIPLHNESLKHQLAMLGTGITLLDKSINIKE